MLGKPITVCPDKVKGDEERLKTFFGYFDTFDGQWNIIEPLKDSSL
jgi:alkyl sulfatase BDS1-like metallo-beta-lactamase superfamily hydrolase